MMSTGAADGGSSKTAWGKWTLMLLLLMAAGAFLLRSVGLGERPLHTDEAIHAVKMGTLLDEGVYVYNRHEFHGPTIYYFSLPFVWLSGARSYADLESAVPMRMAVALFGAGLVLLPLLFRDGLGRGGVLFAGLLFALSPAFVFYSRYFIQEVLLVFFSWAAIGCAWRYIRSPRLSWALGSGLAVGLAQATKETAVITWGGAALAGGLTVVVAHALERQRREPLVRMRAWHLIASLALAVLSGLAVLSNFFRNPAALIDSVATYGTYLGRAGTGDGHGTGLGAHVHPWHYYLGLLSWFRGEGGIWWSEGAVLLLALVGTLASFSPRHLPPDSNRHLLRFLVLYTLMMTVIYSFIPYKTPWNMLGFYSGMIFLAGAGASTLLHVIPGRWGRSAMMLFVLAGAGHLAFQAYRSSFTYPADPRNPYVYGHTSTNLMRLVERIEGLAAVHPEGRRMPVQVIAPQDDYWPLPWYLRRYRNVGFWSEIPDQAAPAPVVVIAPGLAERLEMRVGDDYMQEFFGLRPEVLLSVFIRQPLWQDYLRAQSEGK